MAEAQVALKHFCVVCTEQVSYTVPCKEESNVAEPSRPSRIFRLTLNGSTKHTAFIVRGTMHIKIIIPTNYDHQKRLFRVKKATLPNLTVRYLAAMVPAKHRVTVLEECLHEIDFDEPIDLVALSVLSSNAKRAYEIADEFRRKGVPVVMGGVHITCCPEEALAHADAIVIGEAEDSWPELISDFENKQLQKVYDRPRRESLANLSHPRFDLITPSDYLSIPFADSRIIPIQTSRGCPHDCDFCIVTKFFGVKVRHRPIEDVIEEIGLSGSKVFFFTDDNFFSNYERAEALCKALIPLKIKYICQLDTLSYKRPDLVELLAESGCITAFIGFESISQNNLKSVNKNFSKARPFVNYLKFSVPTASGSTPA